MPELQVPAVIRVLQLARIPLISLDTVPPPHALYPRFPIYMLTSRQRRFQNRRPTVERECVFFRLALWERTSATLLVR